MEKIFGFPRGLTSVGAEHGVTTDFMDAECRKCGSYYAVREDCEPTPLCDECAHNELEQMSALVDQLGNALRVQNERCGLAGDETKAALRAFEERKALEKYRNEME